MTTKIRCSCGKGHLVERTLARFDISEIVGFERGDVIALNATALICDGCEEVTFAGEFLETVADHLVNLIVADGEELRPREVRFLRGELRMTQTELADRFGVSRATVARWEGDGKLNRAETLALRALVAEKRGNTKLLESLAALRRPMTTTPLPTTVSGPSHASPG